MIQTRSHIAVKYFNKQAGTFRPLCIVQKRMLAANIGELNTTQEKVTLMRNIPFSKQLLGCIRKILMVLRLESFLNSIFQY